MRRALFSTEPLIVVTVVMLSGAGCDRNHTTYDPKSVEWVCAHEAHRVHFLFTHLDYTHAGMDSVRLAAVAGDYPRACRALIDYYRASSTSARLRITPAPDTGQHNETADLILQDTFNFYHETGRVPRRHDGGLDWTYRGPKHDVEWNLSLHTMSYFTTLLDVYRDTGRRDYAARIDADTRDWVIAHHQPTSVGDGAWRGAESGSRAATWLAVFYGLQECDEFSPAARVLMLISMQETGDYLRTFHRRDNTNKRIMENHGLGAISCGWSEFSDSPVWRAYSLDQMTKQNQFQVYPDGVHTELAASYHRLVNDQFDEFVTLFKQFGYEVPAPLVESIDRMWNYQYMSVRPDGTTPQNNDSDPRNVAERLKEAALAHHRDDWMYIATQGAAGVRPGVGASAMFPWAGQLIMRSGWDRDAQWAFFDIGPAGTAHQHRDRLHLSIDAFGRPLLVDAGRYNYAWNSWRVYFTGSAPHNLIMIDGRGEQHGPLRAAAPISPDNYATTPVFDFARGVFDAGYAGLSDPVVTTRVVVYVKNEFWLVSDRVETGVKHNVEVLWHFAPDCHVVADGSDVLSDDAGVGNLRITPLGNPEWATTLLTGQTAPTIQGWYSPDYDQKVPATCAQFKASMAKTTTFAWLLVPARGVPNKLDARVVSNTGDTIEVRVANYDITIPMSAGRPEVIEAEKK